MCVECGCNSVGSETGIVPVLVQDVTSQGNAGVTLNMTASRSETERFINE